MKLKETEWLFKQGIYGVEHVIVNRTLVADYLENRDFYDNTDYVLYIITICEKSLKYNPKYSGIRIKDGVVRNLCPQCWELIDVQSFQKEQRQPDLPF